MAKNNDDLPKRENKEQRRKDQAKAAHDERVELESFGVPDREGRPKGDYNYERD